MAELLVYLKNKTHVDPDINIQGVPKRGDIITQSDDAFEWGNDEGLPDFGIIKIPTLTEAQVEAKTRPWVRTIDYEIVAQNTSLDGARIKITAVEPDALQEAGITRADVEDWLVGWGASIFSNAQNEVVFDITIESIYNSISFWEADPVGANIVITETDYDEGTGVHTATIDISGSAITIDKATSRIITEGGDIVSVVGDVITCTFERVKVRTQFLDALKEKVRKQIRWRRYYLEESDCALLESLGGVVTVTTAQASAKIKDKLVP